MSIIGRPTLLTKEIAEEIISYIEKGSSDKDAYTMASVARSTFYNWIQKGEEDKKLKKKTIYVDFLDKVKKAEAKFKAWHIANIQKSSKKQWQASAWLLERKFPEEFARRDYLDVKGSVDVNNFDVELTQEEMVEYKKRLKDMYEEDK